MKEEVSVLMRMAWRTKKRQKRERVVKRGVKWWKKKKGSELKKRCCERKVGRSPLPLPLRVRARGRMPGER